MGSRHLASNTTVTASALATLIFQDSSTMVLRRFLPYALLWR